MPTIVWEVYDGYCGHRPQKTFIDQDDLDECENEDDKASLIEDRMMEAFNDGPFYPVLIRLDD